MSGFSHIFKHDGAFLRGWDGLVVVHGGISQLNFAYQSGSACENIFSMKRLTAILCLTIAVLLGSAGVGYALPPCPGSPLLEVTSPSDFAHWHNCEGQFTVAASVPIFGGDKYVGEFRNGKEHGQGTYTSANGNKYVGEFKNGERQGHFTVTFANGDKYVGKYRNNKRTGQGTYNWANGDKYVGEHRDGKEHGQGTYTYADGRKYVGEFKNGEFHGKGIQ